tara:strand:- start:271 stop:420 length:150 start_codon:yes stop_codon:yes gene_type:complete
MKKITTEQLQSLLAYLMNKPWKESNQFITMLTSLVDVEVKKDTPVTPKK